MEWKEHNSVGTIHHITFQQARAEIQGLALIAKLTAL